jgi:hypothetical protein
MTMPIKIIWIEADLFYFISNLESGPHVISNIFEMGQQFLEAGYEEKFEKNCSD